MLGRRMSILGVAALTLAACRLRSRGTPAEPAQLAPGFDLLDQHGRRVTLADATASGPAIVVFYRGHW